MNSLQQYPPAVIFDLDGTLVDSAPDVAICLNYALELTGDNTLPLNTVKKLIGRGAEAMIRGALDLLGEKNDFTTLCSTLERFIERYSRFPCEQSRLYPDVLEILDHLQGHNVKLGICTNKPLATTTPLVQALSLDKFFPVTVCGDQVTHQKPDKRHIFDTLELMDDRPENVIFVGDSENDIHAARNAKVPCVAVSWGYSNIPVTALGADAIIHSFSELPNTLQKLFKA